MKTFKKYLVGLTTLLTLLIIFSSITLAHNTSSSNQEYYGSGLGKMRNEENQESMLRMREIMWKDSDLTQSEFKELIELQKEMMGWSWIAEDYENVDDFNAQHLQESYNYGENAEKRCPMWN